MCKIQNIITPRTKGDNKWEKINRIKLKITLSVCLQAANGYVLLFDIIGGSDEKYLYEPVYPKWVTLDLSSFSFSRSTRPSITSCSCSSVMLSLFLLLLMLILRNTDVTSGAQEKNSMFCFGFRHVCFFWFPQNLDVWTTESDSGNVFSFPEQWAHVMFL